MSLLVNQLLYGFKICISSKETETDFHKISNNPQQTENNAYTQESKKKKGKGQPDALKLLYTQGPGRGPTIHRKVKIQGNSKTNFSN